MMTKILAVFAVASMALFALISQHFLHDERSTPGAASFVTFDCLADARVKTIAFELGGAGILINGQPLTTEKQYEASSKTVPAAYVYSDNKFQAIHTTQGTKELVVLDPATGFASFIDVLAKTRKSTVCKTSADVVDLIKSANRTSN